ncbi:MAG: hypothetical protein EBS05_05905 [Proteobacteria bacterium]|nr:hypothetical protein [Pseudomonadota bacterium]
MNFNNMLRMLNRGILLCALVIAPRVFSQNLPLTQRIYTTCKYDLVDHQFQRGALVQTNVLTTGSCWLLEVGGKPELVTAAHNLALYPNYLPQTVGPWSFDDRKKRHSVLNSMEVRPVVGFLAFGVERVGFVGDDLDCVLITPIQQAALTQSKIIKLTKTPPLPKDRVTVTGYPGTSSEADVETTISAITNGKLITLNQPAKPIGPGYSGGVVLNTDREAVGIVVTAGDQQATALFLSEKTFESPKWTNWTELNRRSTKK